MLDVLGDSAGVLFEWQNIGYVALGTVLGLVFGVLPGLGSIQAIALALPLTFGMEPLTALCFLGAIYPSSMYGGAITSILINTPGDPTSAATIFDGYPMARRGQAGIAIGAATAVSFIGSTVGVLLLALAAAPLARVAVNIGSPDYFAAAILGLVVVGVTTRGSARKGLVSAGLGLVLSFVGFSAVLGYPRFTFDTMYLQDGIPFVAMAVGLFGLSEALFLLQRGGSIAEHKEMRGGVLQGVRAAFRYPVTIVRGTTIGVLVGLLPGMGATAANFIAYGEEQRASKTPERFGTGHLPGVMAPESSNNASMGASLIPTLTLGIPGSAGAALLLGGVVMHGLRPGASLFTEEATTTYAFVISLLVASCLFAVLGLALAAPLARITIVPVEVLAPIIMVLSITAAYATRQSFEDVLVAVLSGIVGYLMRRNGYSLVPLIVGFVLGPIVENNYHQTMIISDGSYLIFFTRPVSLVLLVLSGIVLAVQASIRRRARASASGMSTGG